MLAQECIIQFREIADFADAPGLQILFSDFADAGDFSHIQRRQKPRLLGRQHP